MKLFSVAILFFLSGLVGLLYEVSWSRQLQLLFGSTVFSVSAVLSSFFAGIAIGSYLFGKWKPRIQPLKLYACMEWAIGLYGLGFPVLLRLVDSLYMSLSGNSGPTVIDHLLKFCLALFLLLPPCVLMGGTLPVLSRLFTSMTGRVENVIGKLYAVNTLGAIVGAGAAGFYLIERFGISHTVFLGALLNLGVGGAAYGLGFFYGGERGKASVLPEPQKPGPSHRLLMLPPVLYGISGFCALASEVLWTRSLVQTLSSSTYAFTSVLCIFLTGTALGSGAMSIVVHKIQRPGMWFGLVQTGIGITSLGTLLLLPKIPYLYYIQKSGGQGDFWNTIVPAMLLTTSAVYFLPAFLMGAGFPLVMKWVKGSTELGSAIGRIYSANTLGAILGSALTGFVLMPWLGLRNSLVLIIIFSLFLGAGATWVSRVMPWQNQGTGKTLLTPQKLIIGLFLICLVAAAGMTVFLPGASFAANTPRDFKRLFYSEDHTANVAVYQCIAPGRDFRILKVNNVYQSGGTDDHGMMVQRRQGHLPMLLHKNPQQVLVIGLATGVTLSAVAEHRASQIDAIELVPAQIDAIPLFSPHNRNVLQDPRVSLVIDDGRSFIKKTSHRYDVIISDLFQVGSAGTGNLYAVEHVKAARDVLNPGGLMVQWVPLQQLFERDFKSILKSFTVNFPHVQLWFGESSPDKPVMGIAASLLPIALNVDVMKKRIQNSSASTLKKSGYSDPYLVVSQCIMNTPTVKTYSEAAPLNTYDHPVIEFSAPAVKRGVSNLEIIEGLMKIRSPLQLEASVKADRDTMLLYTQAQFYNLKAQIDFLNNKWAAAEQNLQTTLTRTPNNQDTRRLLGQVKTRMAAVLIDRGRYKMALDKLDSAFTLGATDVYLHRLKEQARRLMAPGIK